ncbi:hypothetical protein BZG36_00268 [Bifiguratus adelaidae]|uniref:Uncharacterized protein n=1 Tax=Bifiguratus adelaidae TaxID=1938954 RepID=A0A261Y817_9FUNG|nr:hypothetical protein BZG36_00268 [Bifiguratus adelaidae]
MTATNLPKRSQPIVWFITGSSRGFGRVWTEAALARGDKVAATARNPNALTTLVNTYGDAILPLKLDVTNQDAVFQAMNQAHQYFGRLDIILSNAGYGPLDAVEEVSLEDVRANFETNVFGTLSVIQAALPLLRKQGGGHILPVTSIGGVVTFPTVGLYQAAKYAVEGMAETLASESSTMPEYDAIRARMYTGFTPETYGDPAATSEAIFKVVDDEEPPLRLLLGSTSLPIIRKVYADRMATWDKWADVSNAAQGNTSNVQI